MNAKLINQFVYAHFSNYNYRLFNSFVYGWESDFFAVSKSGYSIEVETKISYADFKNDFLKLTANGQNKHAAILNKSYLEKPNKFYFACPENLIKHDEINPNYGLIYITATGAKVIRESKFLHKDKILESKKYLRILLNKFYFRNQQLRIAANLREYDIKYGQKRLYDIDYF